MAMIILLIVGLIKKILLCKMSYFAESSIRSKNKGKIVLDLSNYTTKSDLKIETGVDTSDFANKVDLTTFNSIVDELDDDELKKVPSGLSNMKSKVDKLDIVN